MALASRTADPVYLDASPLYVCCHEDVDTIAGLRRYLGERARVAAVVQDELKRGSEYQPKPGDPDPDPHKDRLKVICDEDWPAADPQFSDPLDKELLRRARALRKAGDPQTKHLGEIATLIQARESGAKLVIMDDTDGRQVAAEQFPRLELMRSEILAAEMTAWEALEQAAGFNMAERANQCSRNMWNQHYTFAREDR